MTIQGSKVKICDMQFSLPSYRTGCIISRHHCLLLGQTNLLTSCPLWHGTCKQTCHPMQQCTRSYRTLRNFNAFKSSCDRKCQALLPQCQIILCLDIQFSQLHFRMQIFLYKMKDGRRQWVNALRIQSAGQMVIKIGRI
jgi:hypothetical protein